MLSGRSPRARRLPPRVPALEPEGAPMNFRNISAWSIRNPVVPIVLFIGLTLAGIVAFMSMKVQDQPDIEFPMVIVTIAQPGAAPTEIENQITQRIESAVRTIAGVDTLSSTATEGSSQTMVQFAIGTDINAAVNEVKNAVDQVRGDLPEGILEPQVVKAQTSSFLGAFAMNRVICQSFLLYPEILLYSRHSYRVYQI
jgi:multidrug efflux pump subunit AcrB